MGIVTDDMRRIVEEQRLGSVATICPDGTPSLSPKGTVTVWDADHLVFADICSPGTVANLRTNPAIEVTVVDPFGRRGYRFKGTATVLADGPHFAERVAFVRARGVRSPIRSVVGVVVERALPIMSPSYAAGATEDEVRARWEPYYRGLGPGCKASWVGQESLFVHVGSQCSGRTDGFSRSATRRWWGAK